MNPSIAVALFLQVGFITYSCGEVADDLIDIQKKYDPSTILPEIQLRIIQNITDEERRRIIAQNFISTAILSLKSTFLHFVCASTIARNILHKFYHGLVGVETMVESMYYTEYPAFYADLIMQQREIGKDKKYTKLEDFQKICAQFYTLINDTKHGPVPSDKQKVDNIRTSLETYYLRNPATYHHNITELHVIFCASISRSIRLFNYISHTVFPNILKPHREFIDILFQEMSFYYFGEVDLYFISVLLASVNIDNTLSEDMQFTYIKVINPRLDFGKNEQFLISRYGHDIYDRISKKEVIIPLSDACPTYVKGTGTTHKLII